MTALPSGVNTRACCSSSFNVFACATSGRNGSRKLVFLWTLRVVTANVFTSTRSSVPPSMDSAASRRPSSLIAMAGLTVRGVAPVASVPPVMPGNAIGPDSWSVVERTNSEYGVSG